MNRLDQLVATALLGTQRHGLEDIRLPSGLELPPLPPEAQLLAVAGTLSLYEQAGQMPQRVKQAAPMMPQETWPRISSLASRYLTMMLEGTFTDLLGEFLQTMNQTEQRLPEEFLPALLERAKTMYAYREWVIPVIGQTGHYLAARNPAWAFALPLTWESVSKGWRSGVMLIRQATVRQARAHDPALGRTLIESTWKQESPTDRNWILKSLRSGLSMDDEPFLETALDDRSHTVRKIAAELLSALPESRLARRLLALAEQVFYLEEHLRYSPPEMTAQLSRDGISQPNWADQERVQAAQLSDFIGLLPLGFWSGTPEMVIEKILHSPWSSACTTGLSNAAERQQNLWWAKCLLQRVGYIPATLKLIPLLQFCDADDIIANSLHMTDTLSALPAYKLLSRWNRPWSETMTQAWLNLLTHHLTNPDLKLDISTEVISKYMSRYCPKTLIPEVFAVLKDVGARGYERLTQEPLLILEFRQKMLTSLGVKVA